MSVYYYQVTAWVVVVFWMNSTPEAKKKKSSQLHLIRFQLPYLRYHNYPCYIHTNSHYSVSCFAATMTQQILLS